MAATLDDKIKFLRGVSEKTRLSILISLRSGEKTVSDIVNEIGASQSGVSQHLACLKGCGMITKRQEGKFCYYGLSGPHMEAFLVMLDTLMVEVGEEVHCCGMNSRLLGDPAQ
ncbi:helix-turn-helix transcriptional regulator [Leclercia sp. W17]|uniref:ArsR/SmtB family transcription factor n=1 Tax=Leclercia sp. W17 TaxID=2282309 RepID=UPI001FED417D|nr:metalloregulator ArsR/SmtB family transcription factor [Leclercia sp. W17]